MPSRNFACSIVLSLFLGLLCSVPLPADSTMTTSLASGSGLAKISEQALHLASNAYAEGAYQLAAYELKRYIFLQERQGRPVAPEIYLRMSVIAYALGDLTQAYRQYESYTRSGGMIDAKVFRYELAMLRGLQSTDTLRLRLFTMLMNPRLPEDIRALVILENLRNSLVAEDWSNAETFLALSEAESLLDQATISELQLLIGRQVTGKEKSTMVARVLSIILPGTGQLYAEQPLDALNAFLVNGFCIAGGVWSVMTGSWSDGLFVWMPLILRFYDGNILNAGLAAEAYNRKRSMATAKQALDILLPVFDVD